MRAVCVSHVFASGGKSSDSERPLSIGGTDLIDSAAFDRFQYTALGHLHGPQQVGRPEVRYAGSLLKYSFSEATQKKGAVLVDLDGDGKVSSQFIPLTPHHDVRILKGSFQDIMEREDDRTGDYVLARIDDTEPVLDGMARLRKKYPNAMAMEAPQRCVSASAGDRDIDIRETTEAVLATSFAAAMRPDQPLSEKETGCLHQLWDALRKEEGGGIL